jgi:hypothetical protein
VLADAPRDLVGRILVVIEKKISFFSDEPRASRFLLVGLAGAPEPLKKQVRELLGSSESQVWKELLAGVDASSLRPGLGVSEALEAIMLLAAGIERRNEALVATPQKARAFDVEGNVAYAKRMLSILRDGLYR